MIGVIEVVALILRIFGYMMNGGSLSKVLLDLHIQSLRILVPWSWSIGNGGSACQRLCWCHLCVNLQRLDEAIHGFSVIYPGRGCSDCELRQKKSTINAVGKLLFTVVSLPMRQALLVLLLRHVSYKFTVSRKETSYLHMQRNEKSLLPERTLLCDLFWVKPLAVWPCDTPSKTTWLRLHLDIAVQGTTDRSATLAHFYVYIPTFPE